MFRYIDNEKFKKVFMTVEIVVFVLLIAYCHYDLAKTEEENRCTYPGCTRDKSLHSSYCYLHTPQKRSSSSKKSSSSSGSSSKSSSSSTSSRRNLNYDPDDYDSADDYADDAWGSDFDDWDDAYDYWEDNS